MVMDNWLLLGRLRTAVKKVRFLLNLNLVNRFRIASSFIGPGQSSSRRMISFDRNRSGLRDFIEEIDIGDHNEPPPPGSESISVLSRTGSEVLQRTISGVSTTSSIGDYCEIHDQEDVDKRAEMFINNFYRQLQMERQVSLELQYCRKNSMESNTTSTSHE